MKAVTLRSFSGPEAVAIADVDPPSTGPNDVLVNVEAAAIGPWDLKTVNGAFVAITRHIPLPQVLGWDFAGTVASVGANVTHFAEGDPVLGFSPQLFTGVGAFAEQVVAAASLVAPRPPDLSPSQAATVPVCGLTAQKLIDTADLQRGDRVLILGAAGAVGGFAAQLALDVNAHVTGTGSTADLDVLRARGIQAIDRKTDLETLDEEPFDLVIDLVGAQASQAAIPLVRANGRLISAVPDDVPHPTEGRRRDFRHRCPTQPNRSGTSMRGSDPRRHTAAEGRRRSSTRPSQRRPSSPSRAESSAARSCSCPDAMHRRNRDHHRHHMGWDMHRFGPWSLEGKFFERGEVRLALLSLLTDGPRHGYELMTVIEERSRGLHRPSAGTIYPTLQQLQDEELVISRGRALVDPGPNETLC